MWNEHGHLDPKCYPICEISSSSESLSIESALLFSRTIPGLPQATVKRQAPLTEHADYVSTSTLVLAIILRLRNSADPFLIYGFVGVVEKIDNLPKLSDVGVWSNLSQKSTKARWDPIFTIEGMSLMNPWRGNESGLIRLHQYSSQ
jgi:hypothetical protein